MAENVNNGTPLDLPNPASSDDQYQIKEEDPSQSNSKEEEKNESVEEQNEEGTATDKSTGKRKAASSSSSSIIWDTELRARFLHVVELLGVDNCTPTKIHQLLNVPGLSKERIASHLKTHRKTLKRMQEERQKLSISIKSESEDEDPTAVPGSSSSGKKPADSPTSEDVGVGKKRSGPILSIENPQMGSKALKIGSPSSARPCSFEQLETNYKGESSADEVMRQPTNFTSYDQLTASQRDQLREALSRTIPYRKPPVVPKLEPYSTDFSCMASNLRYSTSNLGQYYPRDVNPSLQQYSSNDALLGSNSRSTWMNRSSSSSSSSTGFHFPIFESSLGSTSTVGRSLLHGSSEASSMGMTSSWLGMSLTASSGSFLSSYAPENSNYYSRNITMRAPASFNIGNNTGTTQTFSGYGNGREAIVPYMNTSSMQAPLSTGLTNTTQNFFTTYGGNNYREVLTPNYMNATNPAVSSGFNAGGSAQSLPAAYGSFGADQVSPNYLNNTQLAGVSVPQTYTAYGGNREVNPYMSTMEALGIPNSTTQTFSGYNNGANMEVRPNYMNTLLNTGVSVGFTSPTQNIPGAYADDNQATPFGSEAGLREYLDLISSSNPATDWTLPSPQRSGYPLYDIPPGQEQEHDSANSFADSCLNYDSGSVTGDSPVRTPEITTSHQQEAPESPGRRREAELFEMGWDYGLGLNRNDHFPLNGQTPVQDTRAPAVSTTTGGTRNVDLFEMIFTRAREARNAEPNEGMNGFIYSSGSSENSDGSEPGMSPAQQLPDTDPSGTAGPTEESLTSGD
ncbi:hypothetical protein H6P81_008881 [Aristolochia fimbriata]|uniref:HTH myb-type domain-containing protein n=1 Tax=Aristolochia fimbriata TaxID=158543 RepID=A0AAV7EM15_ARIFI|nr:hypothetical protein H6P81_008881 [Aristolochia fimbriata]